MTRNIGKVGLLFKAYYVDAVKRTTNGVAENHSAVSANHSAGSAIPEKNGLVITLSWSFSYLYSSQRWYTNKRWAIYFCSCCFSMVLWRVADPHQLVRIRIQLFTLVVDPDPHQSDGNLRPLLSRPSRTLWASIVDPDPAFHSNADPDPQPWLWVSLIIVWKKGG